MNRTGHNRTENGFCPVWILTWRVSSSLREKRLSQSLMGHLYGRSFNELDDTAARVLAVTFARATLCAPRD